MNLLLDTNCVYQLFGQSKSHQDILKIKNLNKRIEENKTFVSNYTLYEIVANIKYNDEYKKSLIEFLYRKRIKILHFIEGKRKQVSFRRYVNMNQFDYMLFKQFFIKEKIRNEKLEMQDLFVISTTFINYSYGLMIENNNRQKGYESNIIDLLDNWFKQFYQENLKVFEKMADEYLTKMYNESKIYSLSDVFKFSIKLLIASLHKYLKDKTDMLGDFLEAENNEIEKYKDNILQYIESLTRRIDYDNLEDYIIKKVDKQLKNLGYQKPFRLYYQTVLKRCCHNGKFDKNDFTDAAQFQFLNKQTYLITFEKRMIEAIKNINFDNYEFIEKLERQS